MLTRIDNIRISFVSHFFSKRGHVRLYIGRKIANFSQLRLTSDEYERQLAESHFHPKIFKVNGIRYWLFDGKFYKDTDNLKADEVKALLVTRDMLNGQRISRAKTIASLGSLPVSASRQYIPDDVKMFVWQRDRGRCVRCGRGGPDAELQYDHVIPLAFGGASSYENLQILCGRCNRAKGASVV